MNAPAVKQDPMEELLKQFKAEADALKEAKPKEEKPAYLTKPVAQLTVTEVRQRLVAQRDELLRRASLGMWVDGESREWAHVGHEHRVMVMMLAGIDGNLEALATRAWREFTPAERDAVKCQMRLAKRTFSSVAALCSRI